MPLRLSSLAVPDLSPSVWPLWCRGGQTPQDDIRPRRTGRIAGWVDSPFHKADVTLADRFRRVWRWKRAEDAELCWGKSADHRQRLRSFRMASQQHRQQQPAASNNLLRSTGDGWWEGGQCPKRQRIPLRRPGWSQWLAANPQQQCEPPLARQPSRAWAGGSVLCWRVLMRLICRRGGARHCRGHWAPGPKNRYAQQPELSSTGLGRL